MQHYSKLWTVYSVSGQRFHFGRISCKEQETLSRSGVKAADSELAAARFTRKNPDYFMVGYTEKLVLKINTCPLVLNLLTGFSI